MTISSETLSHMNGECGVLVAHSDEDHVGGRPSGCICRYERVDTNDGCRQHGSLAVDEFGERGPIPPHREFQFARIKVTRSTPCAGCGKPMPDEFTTDDQLDLFDGVMNNKLQPFHHGCEDF